MAAAGMAVPPAGADASDWRAQLKLPPKDTRIKTEVRRLGVLALMMRSCLVALAGCPCWGVELHSRAGGRLGGAGRAWGLGGGQPAAPCSRDHAAARPGAANSGRAARPLAAGGAAAQVGLAACRV